MARPDGPPTVVVLGGINMDLIGLAPRMAAPGETVVGQRFYTAPGGKGGNQAVAAARMGAQVKMIGRVGSDVFGPALLTGLRGHGVDVSGVATDPDHASGIAMILLDALRQNRIVAIYGANMRCDDRQLRATEAALESADVLMLQLETPVDVSLRAALAAGERGVTVVWDPAPATVGLPEEAYRHLDVITPNQGEAEALTGIAVTDLGSAARAATALRDRGAPAAVVKLGEQGVFYSSDSGDGRAPAPDMMASHTSTHHRPEIWSGAMADSRVEYLAFGVSRRFPSKVFFAGMEDLDAVRRCGFVPGGESDIARLRRPPTSYQG